MVAMFEEPVEAFYGAPASVSCHHFADRGEQVGYFLETPPVHPMLAGITFPGLGDQHRRFLERLAHAQATIALLIDGHHDDPGGHIRVDGSGRTRISYPLHPAVREAAAHAIKSMARLLLAAGAQEVVTLHEDPLVFKGGSGALFDLDDFEFTTDGSGGAHTGAVKGVTGKCMDVAGSRDDDGTQVQLYGCNDTAAQQWTLPGDGTIRALGKCLDVQGAGTDDGTKIQLYHCNDTVAQQWEPQSDGTVRNPNSGKCLDAEGDTWGDETHIHLWTCHGKANQQWTLPS